MEKIDFYVPIPVKNTITQDAILFGELKKNGNPNYNSFVNKVVSNYYTHYVEELRFTQKTLLSVSSKYALSIDKDVIKEMSESLLPALSLEDSRPNTKLSVKPHRDNEAVFEKIQAESQTTGSGLSRIIGRYSVKPISQRELIVFSEVTDIVNRAIHDKRSIVIKTKNNRVFNSFVPYRIVYSREELFNYIIGEDQSSENIVTSIRLNNVSSVGIGDTKEISSSAVLHLEKMISNGTPQYAINDEDDETVYVYLSEEGIKRYRDVYWGRPEIIGQVDNNVFCFKCSIFQIETYFRRFGKEATVVSPQWLKSRLYSFFSEAANNYKGK